MRGVHPRYPVEEPVREPQLLVRRALADGVFVELAIDAHGKLLRIADLVAFRARLKQYVGPLYGGNAAKAQPLADGDGLNVSVDMSPDAAQARALVETLAENRRKRGTSTVEDDEKMRQEFAMPMKMGFNIVTTVDPRSPWPRSVVTCQLHGAWSAGRAQ